MDQIQDQQVQQVIPEKYDHYTVAQLKQLIKDRKVLHFGTCKKVDYIKSLEDNDAYEKSKVNLSNYFDGMKKDMEKIQETKTKVNDTIQIATDAIEKLKGKDNKTTEDYEKIIKLYDSLLKLSRMSKVF